MARILVIDDERIFPAFHHDGNTVVYARTSAEAIALLDDEHDTWDEVWFDHDLGEGDDTMKVYDYMRSCANTGTRWYNEIRRAYVHSMNPVGAENLRSRIKDFGIVTRRVGLPEGHTTIHLDKS